MKSVKMLLITTIIPFVYACANSDTATTAEQNASPSSHVRSTLLAYGSSSCTYGGVQVEMGIDDNMNGTLDSSEVDKTEYVCNGAPGATGDNGTTGSTGATGATGTTGAAGITPSAQIACGALLQNTTLAFEYKVTLFTDGSMLVHGSIYGNSVEVTDSTFYDSTLNGASDGYINIRYDVSGSANGGDWKIALNRSTLVITVTYVDADYAGGGTSWTLSSSDCVQNNF